MSLLSESAEDPYDEQRPRRDRHAPTRLIDELGATQKQSRPRASSVSSDTSYEESAPSESDEDTSSDYEFGGRDSNDVSQNDKMEDATGEMKLQSKTLKQLRDYYHRLTRKEQEAFDQDQMGLRNLLSLSPDKIYTRDDLSDREILNRALRLLYRARFGQAHEYIRISPHIRYDKLHPSVVQSIKSKLDTDESEIAFLVQTAKEEQVTTRYVAPDQSEAPRTSLLTSHSTVQCPSKEKGVEETQDELNGGR